MIGDRNGRGRRNDRSRRELVCLRCGRGWTRRNMKKLPDVCPSCKSPYWDRKRRGEA